MPDEKIHELEVKFAKMDESLKSMHRRFDDLQKDVRSISDLALSVHEIALEMKTMRVDVSSVKDRITAMESKPAKKWDSITDKALTFVVAAVIAYFMSHLGM